MTASFGVSNGAKPVGRSSQRGVALITAILVVAIATIIATNLLWMSALDQRRTAAALASDQARRLDLH